MINTLVHITIMLIIFWILVRYEQSTGSSLETNSSFSAPVETGDEYTIDVTDNDRAGDAIARISGLAIFIKKYKYKIQKRKDQD